MNYQEEVTKRLIKIKELSQMAKNDKNLEAFREMAFKKRDNKHEESDFDYDYELKDFLSRIFFIPLLKLIQNDSDDAMQFWKLLHRWACERNKTPTESLSLEDVTFIMKKLESTNTKQSTLVLEKFKNFILANEMLDKASPFITSDYVMNNASVPAFLTAEPDLSNFIKTYSNALLKSIIFAYGVIEPFVYSAGAYSGKNTINDFPSNDLIKYFQKHDLIEPTKGIYKHTLDSAKEDVNNASAYLSITADVQNNELIKKNLALFPTYKDDEHLFDLQWSERSGIVKNYRSYLLGLTFLNTLILAREKLFFNTASESIALEELALVIGSKNTKTIRNEFFKNDNQLEYFDDSKESIKCDSASAWIADVRRKQPIYKSIVPLSVEDHTFPDLTLDYIMEL
jgi:hypothetical protein